jgi:hypothetical protein
MSKIHHGQKTSEKALIVQVRRFLSANSYIRPAECHFGRDSDELADVELALESARWPAQMPGYLSLEAKSHHSKDSPNTINKVFGQLLKEANKSVVSRVARGQCLGILIPVDGATWLDSNDVTVHRPSGIEYYGDGFRRIDADVFSKFGRLVNARYVLAFSEQKQYLAIFGWDAFHAGDLPFARLSAGQEASNARGRVKQAT